MTNIRTYRASDRETLIDLFDRAGENSPTGQLWGHSESERLIYLDPYLELDPDSVFLAEQDGKLVGYLLGCIDSSRFPSEEQRMNQAISKYRLMFRPRSVKFFGRALADVAKAKLMKQAAVSGDFIDVNFPSHLHINVAPQARGTGAADALMAAWFHRLDSCGSRGCHLQTLVENTRAVAFFNRAGFKPVGDTPLVPGIRYNNRRLHQQTMVRSSIT